MKKNWTNLPDSHFLGKFVKYGFPFYEERRKRVFHEMAWLKVIKIEDDWLICILDTDLKNHPRYESGTVVHILKDHVEEVMGSVQ